MSLAGRERANVATPAATGGRRRALTWPLAVAGYLLLAIGLTWPLALHLGDRFLGQRPDDAYGHYWNLWWFGQSLAAGRSPYYTPLWYPPDGVALWLGTLAPTNGLLGLLPQALAGPLVAYNLLVLLNITLAGLGGWLLGRWATGDAVAAAIAGLVMAASPFLMGQLNVGHLNVSALYGAPLFAYALLRAADGSRRHVLLAALALLAAGLAEWQTAISALLVAGVLLAWQGLLAARGARPWSAPAWMVAAGLLGGLLLLPFALPTALAVAAVGPAAELGARTDKAANLIAFVLPQELHPLWGDAIHQWRRANLWEPVTAAMAPLGLSVLALAALGVARAGRAALPWLILLGLGVGLAVGPELHIGHDSVDFPTPFALFGLLPYVEVSRNPVRYVLVATIGAAVLAAFGARWLVAVVAGLGARRAGRWAPAPWSIGLLIGLLILFEQWPVSGRLTPPPDVEIAAQVGREVAAIDAQGTILTLPYKGDEQYLLFHQVQHRRPIFSTGGAVSRLPEPPLRSQTPGFVDLGTGEPLEDIVQPPPDPLATLSTFHVRYILYYPEEAPGGQRERYRQSLRRLLGSSEPTYQAADGRLEAWRVPTTPAQPLVRVGTGWHEVESWTGLGMGRWLRGAGGLYLERPAPAIAQLEFVAVSFARPRTLDVRVDGRLIASVAVTTSATPVRVELPSGQGRTTLTLASREGPVRADQKTLNDTRPLTIGVANVRLTTAP